MELKLRFVFPLLVIITDLGSGLKSDDCRFTEVALNVQLGTAAMPVPDSGTESVPVALVTDKAPLYVPALEGTKFTVTIQLAPAASDAPQLLLCEYPLEGLSPSEVAATLPVLDSVRERLVPLPVTRLPNDRDAGDAPSTALFPVPDNATALLPALVANVRVPDCAPMAVGLNVTLA
jgi:hypothetical protein